MADAWSTTLEELLEIARALESFAPGSAERAQACERLQAISKRLYSAGSTLPAIGGAHLKAHRLLLACTEVVLTSADAARERLREEIAAAKS